MTLFLKARGYLETGVDVQTVIIGIIDITYTDIEGNTFSIPILNFTSIRIEKD